MRKTSSIASIVLLPLLLVLLTLLPPLAAASPEPQKIRDLCAYRVLYGFASDCDGGWEANTNRWLHVVGLEDGTTVSLYDIKQTPVPKSTVTIDRMKVQKWEGKDEVPIYFKIVADKPVVATVFAAHDIPERSYATFYPTVNGSFVGREFIFEAYKGTDSSTNFGGNYNASILAVEDSTVEVYDDTGTLLSTISVAANTSKKYDFQTLKVYRVVSTGDIMIRQSPMEDMTLSPSTSGNFVGKMHFGSCPTNWVIWANAYEPGTIKVYNITVAGGVFNTSLARGYTVNHTFTKAGEFWNITGSIIGGFDFYTVSTGNVSVGSGFYADWGSLGAPGYIGGSYNETAAEYWVWGSQTWGYGYIVIFAHDTTEFTVNGTAYTLKADGHLVIIPPSFPGPIYHIVSNKPLTIHDHHGGSGHWGSYLLSPSVSLKKPLPVRVQDLEESLESLNTTINNMTAQLLDRLSAAEATIMTFSVVVYVTVALDAVAVVMYIVERKQRIAQLKRSG